MNTNNTTKPNILFILADDLGWGDVSYHGSPIRTPNIDRLAQNGVELDQHYVCPVCTPTRASLMTGRHPGRFGKHATAPSNAPVLPDGYDTLASMLSDAGYATGLFGKWHLGSDFKFGPGHYGFDTSYGSMAGGVDPYTHRYKEGEFSHCWHRDGQPIEDRGHATDLITDEAIGWIENREEPWFAYVPYTAVHNPVRAPEEWLDRYWNESFDIDPERDRSFKQYAAYTSHMDHAVGRLVETLKRLDQIHNTLIVFTSDNGAPTTNPRSDVALYPGYHEDMPRQGSNYPLRGMKTELYEGGIRTPTAVSWESRLQPRKITMPLQITDWMPTFAALAGCDGPTNPRWDGVNIWPMIEGESLAAPERTLYWNFRYDLLAVRRGDWKLIQRRKEGQMQNELFDLKNDPLEEIDLSDKRPDIVSKLSALIDQEHVKDGDSMRSAV